MPDNRPRRPDGTFLPAQTQDSILTSEQARSDPKLDQADLDLHGLIGATEIKPAATEPPPAPKPVAPPPPPQPKHPPHLVNKARQLGATDQQLNEWNTERLRDEVDNAVWQQNQWLMAQAQQKFENQPPKPPTPPVTPPPTPQPADPRSLLEEESVWEGYDPRFRQLLKDAADAAAELKSLKAEREKEKETAKQKEAQQYVDRFEGCCTRNPDIFGAGTLAQKDSIKESEMAKRLIMDHLMRTLSVKGIPDSDVEKKFDQFKTILFGSAPPAPKPPPQQPVKKTEPIKVPQRYGMEEWLDSGLIAPSAREEPELAPGPERAARSLAAAANGEAVHPPPPRSDKDIMDGFFP